MAIYDKEDLDRSLYDPNSSDLQERAELDALEEVEVTESYYSRGSRYARNQASAKLEEKGLSRAAVSRRIKGASSNLSKRAGLAALAIMLPALLFAFMMLALQTGLRIQQVDRISSNLRFAAFHSSLSSRVKHLAATSAAFEGDISSASATYSRSGIGSRLLTGGFTASRAVESLGLDGDFEFETERVGVRSRITKIVDNRTGRIYDARNASELNAWSEVADQRLVGEAGRGRFLTRRTTNHVFKRSALPFARFRSIIDKLNNGQSLDGTVKSAIVTEQFEEAQSRRGRATAPIIDAELIDDLDETLREGGDIDAARANIDSQLKFREGVWKTTSKASAAASLGTIACIARDVSQQLQDAFRLRIEGAMSNAAAIKTISSQIKAGDIRTEIIGEVNNDLEGFQNASTYKLGSGRSNEVSLEYDFSDRFSNVKIYFLPVSTVLNFAEAVEVGTGGGIASLIPGWGDDIADFTASNVDQACSGILTTEGQIGITVVETAGVIVGSFFGGAGVAGQSALRTAVTTIVKSALSKRAIATQAGSFVFEQFLFNELIPAAIDNISGLDTVFAANSGEQNYASVDYGMNYLKEADCIANGCSRLPVNDFVALTENQLARQRQEYTDQGLWSNIASTSNPYSIATRASLSIPSDATTAVATTASMLGNVFSASTYSSLLGFGSASANSLDPEILLPGQTTSMGFAVGEANGQTAGFSHTENTEWVAERLGILKSEYSECLSIGVVEYMLAEAGVNAEENYPSKCDNTEARRYKMYYQDCLAIEQVIASAKGESSFFDQNCADLAPGQTIDLTDERVSRNKQLLAIASTIRSTPIETPNASSLATTSTQQDVIRLSKIFAAWRGIA